MSSLALIQANRHKGAGRWWLGSAMIYNSDQTVCLGVFKNNILYHRKRDAVRATKEILEAVSFKIVGPCLTS